MSFDREGFKPDNEDQTALLARAVSSFTPKESSDPLAKEAKEVEDKITEKGEDKNRKLTRGKVSPDSEQRHKERYKIKPREEEEEEVEDELGDEEEDLETTGEDDEEFEDEEFEGDDAEDFGLDLANPTVRMLVEQNQRLMRMVESREQEGAQERQDEATLASGVATS